MDFLREIDEILNRPELRHASTVHFPIVLSVLVVPMLLLALVRSKSTALRWLTIVGLVMLAASAFLAKNSGKDAEGEAYLLTAASAAVEEHEALGDWVWVFAAGTLVLYVLSLVLKKKARATTAILSFVAAVATLGWVMETAHHGGKLIYEYAVGTKYSPKPTVPGAPEDSNSGDADNGAEIITDPKLAHFRNTVWPIFDDNCLACHNPDKLKSGFDMTTREGLLNGGEYEEPSIPAIVPGDPEASLLVATIRRTHEDLEMPYNKDKLADADIEAIEQWIADGAVWFGVEKE